MPNKLNKNNVKTYLGSKLRARQLARTVFIRDVGIEDQEI